MFVKHLRSQQIKILVTRQKCHDMTTIHFFNKGKYVMPWSYGELKH